MGRDLLLAVFSWGAKAKPGKANLGRMLQVTQRNVLSTHLDFGISSKVFPPLLYRSQGVGFSACFLILKEQRIEAGPKMR